MNLKRILIALLLSAAAGCSGKFNDQKSFELILENTPDMKLVHMPNDGVKALLSAKSIKIRGDGCPDKFTRVPRGFYEPDGTIQPGCVPSFTSVSMPYEIDYLQSGEKTPIPPQQIAH